jgi:hypothetical protein
VSRASILGTLGLSGFNIQGTVLVSRGSTAQPTFSAAPVTSGVSNLNFDRSGPLTRIASNASTGVVTISAVAGRSDMQVGDWITGRHISDSNTFMAYLSATAYSNRNISASAVTMRLFGTTRGYSISMQVHPNGKIYMFPADVAQTTQGYVIDPEGERIITTFFHTAGVSRAMLAPNGKFYMGGVSTRLIVLDPSTDTVNQTINTPGLTFGYPTLARNGKFYEIQAGGGAGSIAVFDPANNTTTTIAAPVFNASLNVNGSQLAPNGKIYYAPYFGTVFGVIDPEAGTGATYGFAGGFSYAGLTSFAMNFEGMVLAPNGKLYCIPHNVPSTSGPVTAGPIGIINPDDNTTTTIASWIGSGTSGVNHQTAFLAPNGKIYAAPNQDSFVVCIDPETNTTTKLLPPNSIGFPTGQFQGGVMHPNGKAFFVPYYTTAIGVMYFNLNNNWNINVCTNPMFNKQT